MGKLCGTNETQLTERLTHWKSWHWTKQLNKNFSATGLNGGHYFCSLNSWIMEHPMKNYSISQFCVKLATILIVESVCTSTESTAIPCPWLGPWPFLVFSLCCIAEEESDRAFVDTWHPDSVNSPQKLSSLVTGGKVLSSSNYIAV